MKQKVDIFTVNDLNDVYDFCNKYIEQGYKIISVCFSEYSISKKVLIVYEGKRKNNE